MKKEPATSVNLGRHVAECKVCNHRQRDEIEREFINWRSPAAITKVYGLRNRASIYRHAHATGLLVKRSKNIKAALERIIERAGDIEVTAGAVVQAVATYAKINSEGRLIERSERVNLNQLFDRMTREELEIYARDGKLPAWFGEIAHRTEGEDHDE